MPQRRVPEPIFGPRATKRILVVAALAVIAYATVQFAPSPTDETSIAGFGALPEETQSTAPPADSVPVGPVREPTVAEAQQPGFDYFPDH